MNKLQWRVVDEPAYNGFLAANLGKYVFSIEYTRTDADNRGDFMLWITFDGDTCEMSYHDSPHGAMKSADDYVDQKGLDIPF